MKKFIIPLLAALLPLDAALAADQKVLFQVSEGSEASWNLTLNNVKNVQAALGRDRVDVEIVAYGPGIGMLKAESLAGNRVADAMAAGVKVVACENTMKGQKLERADMLTGVDYVPAGVIEIMERQKQGWAYVRP
ncbi:MAG: DsrE family protein [Rhodocyclales bacterium]|nr:DsrE family protein [Rhodocyclales bacterium]